MCGLGPEARWHLNRLQQFLQSNFMIVTKTMLCRVLKKDEDKEKAVDANDLKETSLKVVEGKCSKNICHFWLTVTGELLIVCCQR